jgi:membrane-bound metal-dependent hydrolase YbcI (DUF457 family)
MAGFKTHITVSTTLGVGYGAVGVYLGIPWESALIAGGLCGIGGMLPDIDSDSGVPFRESMCFAAAIIPMFMLSRLQQMGLNHEHMVLASSGMYLFVRFGIARLLGRYTVHRGMFHSIPAALIFAGLAFLFSGSVNLQLRYFKAAGVLLGVFSHLLLDEIYAVEWARGRWRFKKSFGTALKLWGDSHWANFSTYAKLVLVVMMILSEPMVMERYGRTIPWEIARTEWPGSALLGENGSQQDPNSPTTAYLPAMVQPGYQALPVDPYAAQSDRTIYDTARRLWRRMQGETK